MDQTYAEIENIYTLSPIIATTPKRYDVQYIQQKSRKNRNLIDHFDSRLPIEYRYPKKNSSATSSLSSAASRSLASKSLASSSSGYSSLGSTSSITTVFNGLSPFRSKSKNEEFDEQKAPSMRISEDVASIVIGENNSEVEEAVIDEVPEIKKRACCIECREKEIRQELDLESHQYANLQSLQKPQDPYVFLMTSMLTNLQKEDGGRQVVKVQQKIEKVLRLKPREPFNVEQKLVFDRQISTFASDVTIRLRAVSDAAPETYRDVSARFCEALHPGTPNSKGLKNIVKGVKNLLNF